MRCDCEDHIASGTLRHRSDYSCAGTLEGAMNGLIYLIGLVVVIMAILSLFGLR